MKAPVVVIYLDRACVDQAKIEALRDLLANHPGPSVVRLRIEARTPAWSSLSSTRRAVSPIRRSFPMKWRAFSATPRCKRGPATQSLTPKHCTGSRQLAFSG